ncbi:tRNA dimethylallyltransferase [Marinithermofilum abyssi]|uniref:tRNA dimethylallyltransferase n=1 Tax=Marinithermofilum abyssi TaxID=1571185 RepID=A0A8J2VJL4_9BACL|nr:tRNA (adenosine(37)-N6)-dimethylallyltransferase MiaA [Marinithermofilum abyssi]GGE24691.1 tRNA dimethylallyltransferase [Marinithermofilum abyssi]
MKEDLLVIVGPTAVGKTALSLQLARNFHGEIISGDSMQIYRGMDIGTAKASPEERAQVPHHLIDIADPDYPFSVEEFQKEARRKITEIYSRNHLPMLVGGTGLYIQAVTHGYRLPGTEENPAFRREMTRFADQHGNEALHQKLREVDPPSAEKLHPNDRRRIIRALEVYEATGKPFSSMQTMEPPPYNICWVGLTMPREQLYERVNQRVDQMMEEGLVEEVKRLREKGYYGNLVSMQALGYKEIMLYLDGEVSLEEAVNMIKKGTRKFAKRQLSWFRRISEIRWFDVTMEGASQEIHRYVAGNFPQYTE